MIKIIKPYISFSDVSTEFEEIFESGWFTRGKNVSNFQQLITEKLGAKHAFLTSSGTTALSIALKILKVEKDDEVIISDFSFPATANVVEDIGAIPIFADVMLDTFNMSPADLRSKINSKTKVVIFVDALGNPSGIHKIKEICDEYGIPLIEDAACAIGSSEQGTMCGNIADFTCFSFHPRKLITTGEGGAITTNNDNYADLLSIKLNHGSQFKNNKYDFVDYGYNYRLSELQSVMGIKQLVKIEEIVKSRNIVRSMFIDNLKKLGFVEQKIYDDVVFNVQSLVFKVPKEVKRDKLIAYLFSNEVETTIGTYSLSNTTYYRDRYHMAQSNSMELEETTITLPCYDVGIVENISQLISKFI